MGTGQGSSGRSGRGLRSGLLPRGRPRLPPGTWPSGQLARGTPGQAWASRGRSRPRKEVCVLRAAWVRGRDAGVQVDGRVSPRPQVWRMFSPWPEGGVVRGARGSVGRDGLRGAPRGPPAQHPASLSSHRAPGPALWENNSCVLHKAPLARRKNDGGNMLKKGPVCVRFKRPPRCDLTVAGLHAMRMVAVPCQHLSPGVSP